MELRMGSRISAAVLVIVLALVFVRSIAQEQAPPTEPPGEESAASQPTTQTAEPRTFRKPPQAELLRDLLRQEQARPIQPRISAEEQAATAAEERRDELLLVDGTSLVERAGRLAFEDSVPYFLFSLGGDPPQDLKLRLLPNKLLETMEREHEAGFTEFVISAEVTSYRGENYLFLRKVLRRVGHGNLGP